MDNYCTVDDSKVTQGIKTHYNHTINNEHEEAKQISSKQLSNSSVAINGTLTAITNAAVLSKEKTELITIIDDDEEEGVILNDDDEEEGVILNDDDDDIIEIIEDKNLFKKSSEIQNTANIKDNKLLSITRTPDISTSSKVKETQTHSNYKVESSTDKLEKNTQNDAINKTLNDKIEIIKESVCIEIDDEKEEGMITDDDDEDLVEIIEVKKADKVQSIDSLKDSKLLNDIKICVDSSTYFRTKEKQKESNCKPQHSKDTFVRETQLKVTGNKLSNNSKENKKDACIEIDDEKEEGMITDDDDDDDIVEMVEVKNRCIKTSKTQITDNVKDNKLFHVTRTCDDSLPTFKSRQKQTESAHKVEHRKELSSMKSQLKTIENNLLSKNKEIIKKDVTIDIDDEKEEGMISDENDEDVDMLVKEKHHNNSINIPTLISKHDDDLQNTSKESAPKYGTKRSSTSIYDKYEEKDIDPPIKRKKIESLTDNKTIKEKHISITIDKKKEKRIINYKCNTENILEVKKSKATVYVDDGEMPSTSKQAKCASPDYTGIDKLFFIDTTPGLDPNDCVPSFNAVSKHKKASEDKDSCPRGRNSLCFNCGSSEHPMSKCTEPKNKKNILRAKRQFKSNNERYHKKTAPFEHIKPGQLDDEVVKALGLRKGQIPSYRYQMRNHGYPPAWLKSAQIESSGISIIICSDQPKKNVDSTLRYRRSAIIDFAGFNSIPFQGFYDDYKFHNVPPLKSIQTKDELLKFLEPNVVDDDFDLTGDIENDTLESSKNLTNDSIDMELENDDDEVTNVEFCGPLLPNENRVNDLTIFSKTDTADNSDNELDNSLEENLKGIENSPTTHKTKIISSTVLDSYVSTPLLNFSGYGKLPPLSNFQKDVSCDMLLFENLPGATGSYGTIKTLFDKFKKNKNGSNDKAKKD